VTPPRARPRQREEVGCHEDQRNDAGSSVDAVIEEAVNAFREVVLGGVPLMQERNEMSFLSFMCIVAAIDALSGWRYEDKDFQDADGRPRGDWRFAAFVRLYLGLEYAPHAEKLYKFRCRSLHNFSPAHFTVAHGRPSKHLQPSTIGDTVLDDASFFAATRSAAEKYFAEMEASPELQRKMLARLKNADRGGAIFITR
jgi:hypothetical protein